MKKVFKPKPGMIVRHNDVRYVIEELIDVTHVRCRNLQTTETINLPVFEIAPDEVRTRTNPNVLVDLSKIDSEDLGEAAKKMDVIRALTEKGRYARSLEDVQAAANELRTSTKTVYRWLKKFESDGTIQTFLRKERSDKGVGRLHKDVEPLVDQAVQTILMKRTPGSFANARRKIKGECNAKKLPVPATSTIRTRFLKISEVERITARKGKRAAKEKTKPIKGTFPGADFPLAVVQIDHTPLDIIIVDEQTRQALDRPYATVALDVYSRMVVGINIWLGRPSIQAVGLCLTQAVFPKDEWLQRHNVQADWPCFGLPRKILTDNAKEFRSSAMAWACREYGIDIEQRPKGSPEFGGHVERFFKTLNDQVHTLEGTTFSNVPSKFDYDSEGKAIMTMKDVQRWVAEYITKIYHTNPHSDTNQPPLQRYKEGILGTDETPGIGLPALVRDKENFRKNLLPYVARTVQRDGVKIERSLYNDEILQRRIGELDPRNRKEARRFIFRLDPDRGNVVYFYDPDLKQYHDIPTAYLGRPEATRAQLKAARKALIARGKKNVDENMIYSAVKEMEEIERQAASKTKSARQTLARIEEARERRERIEAEKRRAPQVDKVFAPPSTAVVPQLQQDESPGSGLVDAYDDIDIE